jgi:hypothetical protein
MPSLTPLAQQQLPSLAHTVPGCWQQCSLGSLLVLLVVCCCCCTCIVFDACCLRAVRCLSFASVSRGLVGAHGMSKCMILCEPQTPLSLCEAAGLCLLDCMERESNCELGARGRKVRQELLYAKL